MGNTIVIELYAAEKTEHCLVCCGTNYEVTQMPDCMAMMAATLLVFFVAETRHACYCAQCAQPYGVNGPAMWSRANGVKYGCVCLHVDKFAADNRRPAAIARLPEKTKTLQAGHFYNYETQKQKPGKYQEIQKCKNTNKLMNFCPK